MDWLDLLEGLVIAIIALAIFCWIYLAYCQARMQTYYRKGTLSFLFWLGFWQFEILEADMEPRGIHYLRRARTALKAFFGLMALLIVVALIMIFGFGAYSGA